MVSNTVYHPQVIWNWQQKSSLPTDSHRLLGHLDYENRRRMWSLTRLRVRTTCPSPKVLSPRVRTEVLRREWNFLVVSVGEIRCNRGLWGITFTINTRKVTLVFRSRWREDFLSVLFCKRKILRHYLVCFVLQGCVISVVSNLVM